MEFDSYKTLILNLKTKEEIENFLPPREQEGFDLFVNNLVEYLNDEIDALHSFIAELTDDEIVVAKNDILGMEKTKSMLLDIITMNDSNKFIEHKNDIIFLTTQSGKACIENDIDSFAEEDYETLISLLKKLENLDLSCCNFNEVYLKNYMALIVLN